MSRRPLDVALVVDARALSGPLFAADDPAFFVEQWNLMEPRLRGERLHSGLVLQAQSDLGLLRFHVVAPVDPITVTEATAFGVVGVRELATVGRAYRCATCARDGDETYGPFICAACEKSGNRVCDLHVIVLPGAVGKAACPLHRPVCMDCGDVAIARCPGPMCSGATAWCGRHLRSHGSDIETRYCIACYEHKFPACGARDCSAIGSIPCDQLDDRGELCGDRRCPRHARQWQVFGPHRAGLGRCELHSDLSRLTEDEVLYQVLGGCAKKQLRPPSLPGLRHVLMKARGVVMAPSVVVQVAQRLPSRAPALHSALDAIVEKNEGAWVAAAAAAAGEQDVAFRQVQDWLDRNGRANALHELSATGWAKPREGRRGRLFVRCDARAFPRYVRDAAGAELGFDILPERNA